MKLPWSVGLLAAGLAACAWALVRAQTTAPSTREAPGKELDQAVAAMRHVVQAGLTEDQRRAKAQELSNAWQVISRAGEPGAERLKAELHSLQQAQVRDDFFKLGAAALLWAIGGVEEAQTIAEIWSTTPVSVQYNYTFGAAFEAAKTQQAQVLPMLKALLKDRDGVFLVPLHMLNLRWPLTLEFVWGVYGPKGLPALAEVLRTSKDQNELLSAMALLATAQHLESLPRVRELAKTAQGELRSGAIRLLGSYGHPDDYEFLVSGLSSDDAGLVWSHGYALYEYEDLRAAGPVAKLLKSKEPRVRREAIACLGF